MNKVLKEILSTGIYLLVVLAITYLIIAYVGQRTEVNGNSMQPTLNDGDNLIVDKISYRFRDPERFDIIVFPFVYKESTYYIKRIIGLPGETVQIDEEGVKAAAYIELPGAGAAAPPEEIVDFVLDRPFLFVIENDNIPLFAGCVNNP